MILGLDVGSKRIGVAIADPGESFAMPLTVIERTNIQTDLKRLAELFQEYGASQLVVGDPVRLSGERGIASEKIDAFVTRLNEIFSGPVHRVDERLTTAQAQKALIAGDVRRNKRKAVVDKMAAALILDTFLAANKAKRQ
ncbi:MAG TPA: Holliday junction resolvase RuvX [Candidatus Rubrimentiphilum sp.]|nr:Holliday junction resolvase RuvX [Candidatus Rubrimentiphilum sp.]